MKFRPNPRADANLKKLSEAALEDLGPRVSQAAQTAAPILSGELVSSIDYAVDDGVLYLYAAAPHSLFVELGTSRMAAQPYLRPAAFRRWF